MPNIKSAIKRVSVIEKKTLRNNMVKSGYKSAVKKFEQAVEAGNKEEAVKAFNTCNSLLDKAVCEHIKHKNYAARQKARLAKLVNSL